MQIDLQHLYRICAVATQGGGNYFFTRYVLRLSADGSTWAFYRENGILKVCLFRTVERSEVESKRKVKSF